MTHYMLACLITVAILFSTAGATSADRSPQLPAPASPVTETSEMRNGAEIHPSVESPTWPPLSASVDVSELTSDMVLIPASTFQMGATRSTTEAIRVTLRSCHSVRTI